MSKRRKKDLNEKQIAILYMMASGMNSKDIASQLGYTEHTLNSYRRDIYDFLRAENGTHAVVLAIRRGYISANNIVESPN